MQFVPATTYEELLRFSKLFYTNSVGQDYVVFHDEGSLDIELLNAYFLASNTNYVHQVQTVVFQVVIVDGPHAALINFTTGDFQTIPETTVAEIHQVAQNIRFFE
jgi:hypothetical protein